MDTLPTGISRLDTLFGGGAPAGSVVLLAGEVGAGAREFMYTSAVMNALATADPEQFELYYGDLDDEARLPSDIHYLSFTSDRSALVEEMSFAMDESLVEAAVEDLSFADLSNEYFQLSQVPTEWYADRTADITSLGDSHDRRNVLDATGDYLTDNGPGNLVCVDSVTDLVSAASGEMEWADISLLMKGLKKASARWQGLVLLLANRKTLDDQQMGTLMEAADGTLVFEWETGGSERARTLFVQSFRGVLSRLEEENIIRFETEIHDGGFDISDVRKIR
jgi:KaiC/GvpD/RAD55 family RecA-like ATPase